MNAPEGALSDRVKRILIRIPGTQRLNSIRHTIIQTHELSNLIKDGRFVILRPYFGALNDSVWAHDIVHEVVKELLDFYGTVRLAKTTVSAIKAPTGAVLFYYPLALLRIPSSHEKYLADVGTKTRNMIRKAEKQGYEFKEFIWNDHLDEIYEINTSKEVRQSEPMRGWYREPVKPRQHHERELQYRKYYGAFKDGRLYAYLHIVLCGDFAFFKHFLGHAQHLTNGIMNGLIDFTVREYIENSQIRWLKYGELSDESSSMHSFRKHAGFQGYATLLDLDGDQELLNYAKKKVRLIWRF
jgi:hypothetical protein